MAQAINKSILIATLASKPQLITLALDCLAAQDDLPGEVTVVHTQSGREPIRSALAALKQDLGVSYPAIHLRSLEMSADGTPLADVTSPTEVQDAFHIMFGEIRTAKLEERSVHILIAGGRRTLAVSGMAVAQMLFDDQDRLWHLASHPALEASGRLHAGPDEWVRLIQIPVIPWGRLSPVFSLLREVDDPFGAAEQLSQARLREQWDMSRIFVLTRLSAAEKQVVEILVRDGLSQGDIAERLSLSPRTVEQHLRSAYRKAADHWELEDVNQAQLVRLLSLFFVTTPK